MADYDLKRNETLMFFLEHLMGKGQPRTLHDLSCQFGAKGFTKEMRQIAGGSQSGLRKFLLQFPSLFTIDGENVLLTPLVSQQNGQPIRDYAKEAIEFFTEHLQSYGTAEVPLKSLFGHRSQASAEIRHVSGQNIKDFREFLQSHSDVFVVRENYVVLQSVLDQLEQDGHNELLKRMPEEISHDPYLLQQLVNELEDMIYELTETYSNKISIELVFSSMKSKPQMPALWNDFVRVPTDLNTFLHMNSRIFLVQGNMVSLAPERLATLREKKSNLKTATTTEAKTLPITSSQQERTLATTTPSSPSKPVAAVAAMTANQRIRSQIIKIVSQSATEQPTTGGVQGRNLPIDDSGGEHQSLTDQQQQQQFDSIDLIAIRPRIIVRNKDCEIIIEEILRNGSAVAFDLEGVNLGPASTEVTLIQLSYLSRNDNRANIVLFDVFLNPGLIDCGLKKLFESESVVKVGHDIRTNSGSLHKCFGITLKNVFDTQMAHLVLLQQSTGRSAYQATKHVTMYTLCNHYGGPNLNPKTKDRLHKLYRRDSKYWKCRPLTDEMIYFAVVSVYALFPNVYNRMRSQIRPEYEPLLKQLVHESVFAYINGDEIKQLRRQRKFELELTHLKLKLFNNDKKKVVLSNREIRLLRYIDMTDEIRNKIVGPVNLQKKMKRIETKMKPNGDSTTTGGQMDKRERKNSSDESGADDSDDEYYPDEKIIQGDHGAGSMDDSLSPPYGNSGEYSSGANMMATGPSSCCSCHCHHHNNQQQSSSSSTSSPLSLSATKKTSSINRCDIATQTLSTGDIVITKIYFNDTDQPSQT